MKNNLQFSIYLKRIFYGAFGMLWGSGVYWLYQSVSWVMAVHGAAAMVALVSIGWVIPTHVFPGWKAKKNRVGGILIATTCLVLGVTGYGLYYFGGETSRDATSWVHRVLEIGRAHV